MFQDLESMAGESSGAGLGAGMYPDFDNAMYMNDDMLDRPSRSAEKGDGAGSGEPPVPVPVGSPVCAMKPSITRWKITPL